MGNILLLTIGTDGDVRPFLQLGAALKRRGHAVTLLTHCGYAEQAQSTGIDFVAIDTAEEHKRALLDTQLLNNPHGMKRYVEHHVLPKIVTICDLVRARHRPGETILFSHSIALLHAQIAAEYLQLPLGMLFMSPMQISSLSIAEQVIALT